MKAVILFSLSILLTGCPSGGDPANESNKPAGVIPEHQLQALDKAKATEQMLIDAEARRRQQMDDI